jgi:Na+-translocating ferredoxin:NAD+ oxidoreductase RnfC subunit
MCTDLCPRFNLGHRIEPHLTMRVLLSQGLAEAPPEHVTSAFLCCLCGVCEVMACPLHLSPRKVYEQLRADLFAAKQQNPLRNEACTEHPYNKQRRIPLPRLIARLGLDQYLRAPDLVEWDPLPVSAVRILLSQHTGAPAQPVVTLGQRVVEGDLIGEIPEGKLGARVHASIGGTVTKINEREVRVQAE